MTETKSQLKSWQRVKLKDVSERIDYGYTASAIQNPIGPKFLRITDIVPDIIDWDSVPYCRIDEQKLQNYKLEKGDIVIARTGATTGYAKQFKGGQNAVFASYLVRIRPNKNVDAEFVGLIVQSDTYKDFIKSNLTGAAQPQANAKILTSFDFLLPPFSTQQQIADILSTYDDFIENNTKRIKILEEMTQAIYREWFVYFRFLGHEKVKMVDSKTDFGKIPEGWKIGKVKDVVNLLSGYAFKGGTFVEGGKYKIITIKSVHDGQFKPEGSDTVEIAPGKMPEHCYLKDGNILLSLTGNIGRACLVYGENLLLNQRVAKLDYTKSNRPFVYGLFRNSDFQTQLQNLAIGAAQQNLSPVQTAELSMVIPAVKILDSFNGLVESILKEIVELNKRNFVLRQARDLLLPKLVTGEVEVK